MSVSGQAYRGVVLASGTAINSASVAVATNTTWYQLVASTTAAIYVTAIFLAPNLNGAAEATFTIDLATGAAGSETLVSTLSATTMTSNRANMYMALPIPLRITSGVRVAIRYTGSVNVASSTSFSGISYIAESSVV